MATPYLSDPSNSAARLSLHNGQEEGGRWTIPKDLPAVLRLTPYSSGVPDPLVRIIVDWGDGSTLEISERVAVGREQQFMHLYEDSGDYSVVIRIGNADGELSAITSSTTLSIRMSQQREAQKPVSRWRGLALPVKSIASAVAISEENFSAREYTLAASAQVGTDSVYLTNDPGIASLTGAEYTIVQPGKFISSGRIIQVSADGQLLLDSQLSDSYDPYVARIDVQQRNLALRGDSVQYKDASWGFPSSNDDVLIRSAVAMLIGTRRGERLMEPLVGSNIHAIPFEQADVVTQQLAFAETVNALRFEPRFEIIETSVSTEGNDETVRIYGRLAGGKDGPFDISVAINGHGPVRG